MNNQQFRMKKIILSLAAVLGTAPALASATDVEWGGDIIIRPFHRDNARDFSNSATDTKNFTTERARLKANIKVDEDIGGVVELLHFRKWGAADPNRVVDANTPNNLQSAIDDNWMDLNQAYIEVKNLFDTPLYMKAGRQEMAYGDQRLVGNTNFWSTYPFPRAYDAVRVGVKNDAYDIDAWMGKVTERQMSTLFGSTTSSPVSGNGIGIANVPSDRNFNGIWATLKTLIPIPDNTLDLYVLNMTDGGYTNGTGTVNGVAYTTGLSPYEGVFNLPPNFGQFPWAKNTGTTYTDSVGVYNWGTRLKGKYSNLDYTVELNHQTGKFADAQNISADGDAVRVGYTIPEAMGLRINGEYVYASGDNTPTSGDHNTFYQFTPSPHGMLGAQDFIAFQNIRAVKIGASFNAKSNLKLSADFWNFRLATANDNWYGSNGISTRNTSLAAGGCNGSAACITNTSINTGAGFVATGAEGHLADRNIGTELDLIAKYEYSKPLTLELGYSVFNPGSGIKNALPGNLYGHTPSAADSATFTWAMLMLKF